MAEIYTAKNGNCVEITHARSFFISLTRQFPDDRIFLTYEKDNIRNRR